MQSSCIAMASTDGLQRGHGGNGYRAADKRSRRTSERLGRIFNVLGETVDNGPAAVTEEKWSIHRSAPSYDELSTSTEILETGIKGHRPYLSVLKGAERLGFSAAPE